MIGLLKSYGAEVCEPQLGKYDSPLGQHAICMVLARADCDGREAAKTVTQLTRATLERVLPNCTVQELLFEEEDWRFADMRRDEWKRVL